MQIAQLRRSYPLFAQKLLLQSPILLVTVAPFGLLCSLNVKHLRLNVCASDCFDEVAVIRLVSKARAF